MNSPAPSSGKQQRTKKLFIVESPGKVKTIQKFLSDEYIVRATIGHIADIPESAAIELNRDFACRYELSDTGRKVIADLKKDLRTCSEVILATDADREGEMIAAHVVQFLKPDVPVSRVTFNAITKDAVLEALRTPRSIDWNVVEAARARRVVDRLFGFEVTAVTRSKIRPNVTAGRVQSPGLCLVVERELERLAFVAAEYVDVVVQSATTPSFTATLSVVAGRRIAAGKDFNDKGELTTDALIVQRDLAERIAFNVSSTTWPLHVADIAHKPATSNPRPPLDMSGLYQDAEHRLGMSTSETKAISEKLYQQSLITYPRTDIRVHDSAGRKDIRSAIRDIYGADAVCPFERYTKSNKKLAQGAHPAIKPTNMRLQHPKGLGTRELALYELIWKRTMATQMVEAKGTTTTVKLRAGDAHELTDWCEFTASGTVYTEPGFRRVYASDDDVESAPFPELALNDHIPVESAEAKEHHTKAPARYVAATLIKELEERGIGRPSTYESIIRKLKDRFVFSKPGTTALIPTVTGLATYRLLQRSFLPLVDYGFTSNLEDQLDAIVEDVDKSSEVLHSFYFGTDPTDGLQTLVSDADTSVNPRELFALDLGAHPESGHHIYVRPGRMFKKRFSPYLECDGRTISIDDETCFEDLTRDEAVRLLSTGGPRVVGDIDGVPVFVKVTSTGAYFQHGEKGNFPAGHTKPRTAPLLESMNPATVNVSDALTMFSLPREVGVYDKTGVMIVAHIGRYGAYVKAGEETRSLKTQDDAFTVDVAAASALLDTPKKPRFTRKKGAKSAYKKRKK